MTADAIAINIISVPPARGSIDPMRKQSNMPAKNAANNEISNLDETGPDAYFRGSYEVAAGGNRVHAPACFDERKLENDRDACRPQDLGNRIPAKDVSNQRSRFGRNWKPA
jgi:hypothetical protein